MRERLGTVNRTLDFLNGGGSVGALMRARRVAYRVSGVARSAAVEPTGSDWIA